MTRLSPRAPGRGRALLVALLLVGGAASRASAQSAPFETEERTTAGWVFTPGASVGGFWDSGISTSSNVVVETLFQRWVGMVNPWAQLDFNGRRGHFDAGYSGAIEKYWASNTNWEQRGHLSARHQVTRRFSVGGDLGYAAAPTTDRLELVEGIVPFVQVDSKWFNAGGSLQYRVSPRTSLDAGYRFERVSLDRPEGVAFLFGTLHNGHSYTPSLGIMHAFTERLTIGGRGELRREFIDDTAQIYDVQGATGEFSYRVTPTTVINGGGGASRLLVVNTDEGTTGPTFHGGFSHTVRRTTFSGDFERAFRPLFGFGSLGNSSSFSGSATVPLGEDHLYYLKTQLAYSRTSPIDAVGIGFKLDTLWLNAAVGRQLNRWVRAEGFITVASQSSQIGVWPGGNRHRIGIQIATSKPLRIE